MKNDMPYFIDFEASSLSFDSYPIEIAWGSDKDNIETYLISPKNISHWVDWSEEAQKIHGIQRSELLSNGHEPEFVCERVYEALDNQKVYSDAAPFDMDWLKKLFESINVPLPNFAIRDINELLIAELVSLKPDIENVEAHIDLLKKQARAKVQRQHRANFDVEYLLELYRLSKSVG